MQTYRYHTCKGKLWDQEKQYLNLSVFSILKHCGTPLMHVYVQLAFSSTAGGWGREAGLSQAIISWQIMTSLILPESICFYKPESYQVITWNITSFQNRSTNEFVSSSLIIIYNIVIIHNIHALCMYIIMYVCIHAS